MLRRDVRFAGAVLVSIALVATGIPKDLVRFAHTGQWSVRGHALAAGGATTTRVSVSSTGTQADADSETQITDSFVPRSVSSDGRYVAFQSWATNLVSGVSGTQIYLRDREGATTTLVSVAIGGAAGNGRSHMSSISGDGRHVVFASAASDLVSGDTNGVEDVFVRDLVAGTTTRASVSGSGAESIGGGMWPYISGDGRYVVFEGSSDLGGPAAGIYLRDVTAGITEFISVSIDGGGADDEVQQPTVSDDGRYVSFYSRATNLSTIPKTNSSVIFDVYVRDRSNATTHRVSVSSSGQQGNAQSNTAVMSGNGRYVLFRSGAENLISGDGNFLVDLFIRDLSLSSTFRVAEDSQGGFISTDGRFIAFMSWKADLVLGDTNGTRDIFLRDRYEGTVELMSQSSSDAIANSASHHPSVSSDGRSVVYTSTATNLVTDDTNAADDVFVRERPIDEGASAPYTYGGDPNGAYTSDNVNAGTGVYTTAATDLRLPGRVLPLEFRRVYNSADAVDGPLGRGWSHSFHWKLADAVSAISLRRGDGQRDLYMKASGGGYTAPPNVYDTLVKNGDATFTLTLKNQLKYDFSSAGQLTRVREPAGNQISLTYASGNLSTITDAVGRAISLSYDASSRLTQVQDPLGRKVTYMYDASGRLATATDMVGNAVGQDPARHRWQYTYDGGTQHLSTITDPDGRVVITNAYDAKGRVIEQRDGLDQLTTITYGDGQTTTVDARLNSSIQTYDDRKRALTETRVVSGQTLTLSRVYDTSGNPTSVTDRNGGTTDYTYDSRGNALTKTDPQVDPLIDRYVTQFVYDSKNNPTSITDARGFVTSMAYDGTTNLLLSVTKQISGTTSAVTKYEYGDTANKGLPTRIIAPRGNLTPTPDYAYALTMTYKSQGSLVTRVDPDGAKTTWTYDSVGRALTRVSPDGNVAGTAPADHTWGTSYSENDQVKTQTDPLGAVTTYTYDGAGNTTAMTDRLGNVTTYGYDANSRLTSVQQKPVVGGPVVYTTSVRRDANGNATRVTQANGVVTDSTYDELDRQTSYSTYPDGATTLTTSLTLDGNGNVVSRTTPAPELEVTTFAYDALSRLTSVSSTGLPTITYEYDATGNRTALSDGTGTSTYQYDGLARMTQATQPNGTLTYGYDRDGNRTSMEYPGGTDTVAYFYTPGGRLDRLTDGASRTSTYTYTASGLVETVLLPSGLKTTYAYDRAQRTTLVLNAVGSATRTRHSYALDKEGNRVTLDEFVEGITAAPSLTWSASSDVNSVATGAQDNPAIALGADRAAYLLWDDARSGNADIYFARRDAAGTWSADVKVNNDTGSRAQLRPAVSVDASGHAYAVWQDERHGAGKPDIYYSKRDAATATWLSPNVKLNDDGGGGGGPVQKTPRIAGTAAGAQTAVWVDLRSSQNNIWSSQLATGASTWAPNKRVTDETAATKELPDVAVSSDGTAHAVWQDSRSGNPDIYYSRLTSGAVAWSANVKISDDPGAAAQRAPRIGVDSTGNLTVVWLDDRTAPATIRMTRLPSGKTTWAASTLVTDAAARPLSLAFSVRPDGKAYVSFHDDRGSSTDVYATEHDPWFNTWTTSAIVSDDPASLAQQSPTIAYTTGELVVAWRDDRGGTADVRARRAALTGTDRFDLSYDGLQRLSSVGGTNAESFMLDAASNISARTGPSVTYTYDAANRLTSDGASTFGWSPSDRLMSRGGDSFAYDPLSRMTSSTVAGIARNYSYNGDGLLQSRTEASGTTSYLWDLASSPARLLKVGGDRIVHGQSPLYAVAGSNATTFAPDALDSIRAEVSDAGSVVASFRYLSYGAIAQSFGSATPAYLGYAGEVRDPSGLTYLRARWYDPQTGRFMTTDPVAGDPLSPLTINQYLYSGASPAMRTDPSGLFCVPCVLLIGYWLSQAVPTGVDIAVTASAIADPSLGAGEKALMVAMTVGGAVDPIGGGYTTIRAATRRGPVASAPDFVVSEGGVAVPIPAGAAGPVSTRGAGHQYVRGAGGHGLSERVTGVRIMDPDALYPGGRASYMNIAGQTVNPWTGQTIAPGDRWAHIGLVR